MTLVDLLCNHSPWIQGHTTKIVLSKPSGDVVRYEVLGKKLATSSHYDTVVYDGCSEAEAVRTFLAWEE